MGGVRDGSWDRRSHGAGVNFLVFTTVPQQGAPGGINNPGKRFYVHLKGGKCLGFFFYNTFIFDSYSFRCWEESNMTAASLPPVTVQLLGKHSSPRSHPGPSSPLRLHNPSSVPDLGWVPLLPTALL